MSITILHGDNLQLLKTMGDSCFDLIFIDPPFNTGNTQSREDLSYRDNFEDYESFLMPRIVEMYRTLTEYGSIFVLLDWRESHYVKCWMDKAIGRDRFMNSIIWNWDYGGRSKKKWPAKHNEILWYVKNPKQYIFNYDQIDRVPYLAPSLVGKEKAQKGKTLTNVWFNTIVPTMGKEKTGYPTQKPLGILNRIVKVHSNPNDKLLDAFAGSGSFGQAANDLGRNCVLIDNNPDAIKVMNKRFGRAVDS